VTFLRFCSLVAALAMVTGLAQYARDNAAQLNWLHFLAIPVALLGLAELLRISFEPGSEES
jgi:hypothetical protein